MVKAKGRGQMDVRVQRWEAFFYMETLAQLGIWLLWHGNAREPGPLWGRKGLFCPPVWAERDLGACFLFVQCETEEFCPI